MITAKPGNWLFVWIVHWPVPRLNSTRAPLQLERRRVEAVEVELADLHDRVRLGEGDVEVAPLVDARSRPGCRRSRRAAAARRLRARARVDERRQRLVLDLDELGGVARELARLGDDDRDRLADVPHLADGERVVLHVCARRRRDLEERVGERRHLLADQRPVDTADRLGLRDVDRDDVRVRVRRADEVRVAHPVPLDVVDEEPLALDEPLVLLARHALAGQAALRRAGLLDDERLCRRAIVSLTARDLLAGRGLDGVEDVPVARAAADVALEPLATSSSLGDGLSRSSAVALISIPGVQ